MKLNRNIPAIFFGMIIMINLGISQPKGIDSASLIIEKSTSNMIKTLNIELKLSSFQKEQITLLYHQHFNTDKGLLKISDNNFEDDVMHLLSASQKERFSQLLNYNHRTKSHNNIKQ